MRDRVVEAQRRELPARLELQAQVFAIDQRTGDHERLEVLPGFVDQLFVARQRRRLALFQQLHVQRGIFRDHASVGRGAFGGCAGPGLGQAGSDEGRVRMALGLGQQQVQLEGVVGLDDRGHLLLVQAPEHFFGQ
ncbi:hypothetical protein D3C75_1088100 [compost metagenome]